MGMQASSPPNWLAEMNEDDLHFLRRFLLQSGSLKAVAEEYGVSYPTVRARLDRLIAKVQAVEAAQSADPFERKLKAYVAEGLLSPAAGKELLTLHKTSKGAKS